MTVELACVDPARVREIWDRVAPMLQSAIDRTGLSPWQPVADDVLAGRSLLWLCVENEIILCAGATRLEKLNNKLVCVITACGGSDMTRWVHLLEKIEVFARAEGCRCTRIFGRVGWHRVLDGYRTTNVVLEKELT